MKTKLITLALTLLSCAGFSNNGELNTTEISRKVKTALTTPESIRQKNRSETITIRFVVNETGKVTEVLANTKNKDTKANLEQQFMNLEFKELPACVQHSIDVNFVIY